MPTDELRATFDAAPRADARYELLESTTLAFLLALEALGPLQRAVLLLRDVFDYSVRETAAALELSEANVKTTLHRARAAMAAYDAQRCVPDRALYKRTEQVLRRFLLHLATDNVRAIEALLREDVVSLNDPGDEYVAARRAVVGRRKVVLFNRKIARLVDFMRKQPKMAIVDLERPARGGVRVRARAHRLRAAPGVSAGARWRRAHPATVRGARIQEARAHPLRRPETSQLVRAADRELAAQRDRTAAGRHRSSLAAHPGPPAQPRP